MFETERAPIVTVQLTYLDRIGHRSVIVNTCDRTVEADLTKGTITIDSETETLVTHRDDSYRAMHQAALAGDGVTLCTLDDALDTIQLVEAAEQSAVRRSWVER